MDICMHMADTCCCTAENDTILLGNYSPIKNKISMPYKSIVVMTV